MSIAADFLTRISPSYLASLSAVRLRNRDVQHSAATQFSVQRCNGTIGFRVIGHSDVSEILTGSEVNSEDISVRLEECLQNIYGYIRT